MPRNRERSYTIQQLLDDAYFISSVKNPTLESDMFWKDAIKKGYLTHETYRAARNFILAVQPKGLDQSHKEEMWEKILKRNAEKKRKIPHRWFIISSAVASLIAIVILSVNYLSGSENMYDELLAVIEKPDFTVNEIQLILSDEKPLTIKDKNANIHYTDKGEIVVTSDLPEKEIIPINIGDKNEVNIYNQLIIPKGQQSSLLLSDGTKMWINAGSRVIYPPVFNQKERIIHVEGEVFLDVFHDKERPFIVRTKEFDIRVMGTSFNICTYDDQPEHAVVLVEGAVKVKTKDMKEEINLTPNQKLTLMEKRYHIETVNVQDYTVWKNGYYQYRRECISHVANKLSYYYNKTIFCDEEVGHITCSGKLYMKQDIENVLETLCKGAVPLTFYKEGDNYYIRLSE